MKAVMYHYVRPFDPEFPNFKNLHIDDFKQQLNFFEEEYGFITKQEFIQCLKNGKTKEGVILTFDDGLSCHSNYVFNELKEKNLWGIFYIPTLPYVEKKIIDVHRIHLLLGKENSQEVLDY